MSKKLDQAVFNWIERSNVCVAVLVLLTWTRSGSVQGYGLGAPKLACETLRPQHDHAPMAAPCPYNIDVVGRTSFTPGETLTVKITGTKDFEGFILQARDGEGRTVPGNFNKPAGTKVLRCTSPADTITHGSNARKDSMQVTWTPPDDFQGPLTFTGTVLAGYTEYWSDIEVVLPTQSASSTTRQPTPSVQASQSVSNTLNDGSSNTQGTVAGQDDIRACRNDEL